MVVGLLLCAALPLHAQAPPTPTPASRPRVGVVLSGGSAKGFAHIGVLRVLEEAGIRADVVTGTSMGSLVGGLYAIGYGPDALEEVATSQQWDLLFSDPAGPAFLGPTGRALENQTVISFPLVNGRVQLPSGLVAGQQISRLLARLTWPVQGIDDFRRLPIPFAAVATDIETGEAVTLDRGSLAMAMRASLSLPGVFRPVTIDGRLLVDGGIARNLPSEEAKALGAEILICSDVSEPPLDAVNLRSLFDVLMQTVTFQMEASTIEQRSLCDVLIRPDIGGLSGTDFTRAAAWIGRGDDAARAQLPAIEAALETGRALAARPEPLRDAERQVDALVIEGVTAEGQRFAERVLALPVPGSLTATRLDDAVDRLYRSGAFDRVTYRIAESAGRNTLIIEAVQRSADLLGFGFRYDSRFKASLLFDATLHNIGRFGSTSRVAIRLGEQFSLSGQHLLRAGSVTGFITGVEAGYAETPVSFFVDGRRVAEARVEVANVSAFAGRRVGRRALVTMRVTGEHARGGTRVAAVDAGDVRTFYTLSSALSLDTLDQPVFARRGVRLLARTEGAARGIGSGGTFWQHLLDVQAAVPLTSRWSLQARTLAGAGGGDDLPFHYRFFLGSTVPSAVFVDRQPPFPGLPAQGLSGRAVQVLQVGAQFEPSAGFYLAGRVHVGNTGEQWQWAFDDYRRGYEIALGAASVLGPLEVVVSGSGGRPGLEVRLGRAF